MKNFIFLLALTCSLNSFGQLATIPSPNTSSFELGKGLQFSFNNGAYKFKLGGMMQPYIAADMPDGEDAGYFFNAKRTYFNFSGSAAKEKVDFFIQTDFSLGQPLLDAWVAYHPIATIDITFGQKQNIGNNREMLLMEDQLQFADRGLLSSTYAASGREFGLFVSNTFSFAGIDIIPQISLTSGDGRNSFGADSRDIDLGGFKYSARLDIYPLGSFTEGNDKQVADLAHEAKPKMVIGGAASFNDGASNTVGEGHGDLFLYNALGQNQLPDYRKVYGDILVKYNGFSFLGEYTVATATNLQGAYIDPLAGSELIPTQISEYLALGTGYNATLGYATKGGYGVDFRLSSVNPEFTTNGNSIVAENNAWTLGLTKYVKANYLKLHAAFSSFDGPVLGKRNLLEFMAQVVF